MQRNTERNPKNSADECSPCSRQLHNGTFRFTRLDLLLRLTSPSIMCRGHENILNLVLRDSASPKARVVSRHVNPHLHWLQMSQQPWRPRLAVTTSLLHSTKVQRQHARTAPCAPSQCHSWRTSNKGPRDSNGGRTLLTPGIASNKKLLGGGAVGSLRCPDLKEHLPGRICQVTTCHDQQVSILEIC